MATHHALPGEVVDLATWDQDLPAEHSKAIAKIHGLEIARLVLAAGEDMHSDGYCQVRGPIVIHCLEGELEVATPGRRERIGPGQLMYLEGGTEHGLKGIRKSIVLLTFVLDLARHDT